MLAVIAIVGTYSRGALIGLGALGLFTLLRLRNRFVYLTVASFVILFVANFMPEHFLGRVETIYTPTQDLSFEGRLYT
jgi:ABC-type proline/glycine betaine transport system permease subunit